MKNKHKSPGFTLLEMVLTISLLGIITVSGFGIYTSFLERTKVNSQSEEIQSAIRTAKVFTDTGKAGSGWGVNITTTEIIVYAGSDFNSRDISLDLIFNRTSNLQISGDTNINFAKSNFELSGAAQITIANNLRSSTINISENGVIQVNNTNV